MNTYYDTFFTTEEKTFLENIKQVIIWGCPLHTHTQSYIDACWKKTFDCLGVKTYWFHDNDYPHNFDFLNSIFITEGYADKNIPINSSSIYFVNNAIHPEKYISKGARLIDIRLHVREMHDCNISFDLNDGTHTIETIGDHTWYEKLHSNKDVSPEKRNGKVIPMEYECVYLYWATDLLPHEFDFNWIHMNRQNLIHYIGTDYSTPNKNNFRRLSQERGIQWISHDPWRSPISFEDARNFMQQSILAPDFRPIGDDQSRRDYGEMNGKNHLGIGHLACRILKAISYGHLGITDSPHVKAILGEHVEYDSDMLRLLERSLVASKDKERISRAMKYVQENHTYMHRVRDLIRVMMKSV